MRGSILIARQGLGQAAELFVGTGGQHQRFLHGGMAAVATYRFQPQGQGAFHVAGAVVRQAECKQGIFGERPVATYLAQIGAGIFQVAVFQFCQARGEGGPVTQSQRLIAAATCRQQGFKQFKALSLMAGPNQRHAHVVAGVTAFIGIQGHGMEVVQGTGKVPLGHEDIGQHQATASFVNRLQPFHVFAIENHGRVGVVAFAVMQGCLVQPGLGAGAAEDVLGQQPVEDGFGFARQAVGDVEIPKDQFGVVGIFTEKLLLLVDQQKVDGIEVGFAIVVIHDFTECQITVLFLAENLRAGVYVIKEFDFCCLGGR